MKFYQTLTYLLLFTIPFFPVQLDGRITYATALYALVLLPVFLKSLTEKVRKKDKSTIFFLIFLSAASLSTIFSINSKQSLPQLALFFASFVTFVSIGKVFDSPKSRRHLALVFLLVTSILAVVSLYNTAVLHLNNLDPLGVSFLWVYFGHNHLSTLLLFAIPIALYFAKVYWKSPLRFLYSNVVRIQALLFPVLSFLLLVSLCFTFARASQISLLAAVIFAVIIYELIGQKITLLVLAVFLAAIGIILAGSATPTRQLGFVKYASIQNNSRLVYWQQAIENAKVHPFLGTGPDTFRFINQASGGKTLKTYYTHNYFLQTLTDSGIFAFLSGIALIVSVLINAVKSSLRKKEGLAIALTVGLLASTINSLFDFDWQLPVVFLIFWIFAGLFLPPSQKHE